MTGTQILELVAVLWLPMFGLTQLLHRYVFGVTGDIDRWVNFFCWALTIPEYAVKAVLVRRGAYERNVTVALAVTHDEWSTCRGRWLVRTRESGFATVRTYRQTLNNRQTAAAA